MKSNRVFYFWIVGLLLSVIQIEAGTGGKSFDFCDVGGSDSSNVEIVETPNDGGIREQIPDKYRVRYEKWRNELLATEFGREQWNDYAANKNFVLTIKISGDEGQGAGTSDYQWNDAGELVGATIVLGSKIDKGYPNPIYFPVVNSLSVRKMAYKFGENILAAAKFAHEFGHIKQTAKTGGEVFRRQNRLMTEYNEIFRAAGYGLKDARLDDLQEKLGGTPVQIWENREYWGEANAMFYVVERIEKEDFYCSVIGKIENNVKTFAANYEDRFLRIIQTSDACSN